MTFEVVALASRFALGSLFLLAGLSKLARRKEFEAAVRGYEVLPPRLAVAVAVLLPPFELVSGVALAVGFGTAVVALSLAAVLIGFNVAVGINLRRGREIDCGCSSATTPRRITWLTVGRNLLLAAAALTLAWKTTSALAVERLVFNRGSTAVSDEEALAVGVAVTAALAAFAVVRDVPHIHRRAATLTEKAKGTG